ncbi:MAG: hypothetical protein Q9226_004218 [Calogaya cf. arnoldii]
MRPVSKVNLDLNSTQTHVPIWELLRSPKMALTSLLRRVLICAVLASIIAFYTLLASYNTWVFIFAVSPLSVLAIFLLVLANALLLLLLPVMLLYNLFILVKKIMHLAKDVIRRIRDGPADQILPYVLCGTLIVGLDKAPQIEDEDP